MNGAASRGRECKCYVLLHFKMIWINLSLIFSRNVPLKMEYAFGDVTCMDKTAYLPSNLEDISELLLNLAVQSINAGYDISDETFGYIFLEEQILEQWKDAVNECLASVCLVTLGQILSELSSDDSQLYVFLMSAFVFLEKCLSKQIIYALVSSCISPHSKVFIQLSFNLTVWGK